MKAEKIARRRYAKSIEEMHQLPPLETLCPEYRFMTGGEVRVHKLVGEKSDVASCEEVAIWTPNLLPVGVPALLRNEDEDDTYGLRVCVQDMSANPAPLILIAPNWRGAAPARSGRDCLKPGFALTAMVNLSSPEC